MAQEQAHAGGRGMPAGQGSAAAPTGLEDYDRRLASEPGNGALHAEKIALLCGLGRHEDALGACDAAIARRPGDARLLARKAHILHRLGRHGEAMVAVELAMGAPEGHAARGAEVASHQAPSAATSKQARRLARAAMAGELAGFVAYLANKRIIKGSESVDTFEGSHRLQKYAYIAKALGMRIGYRFDFIESGAFSTNLAIDAHRLKTANGVIDPFRPETRSSEEFVRLVNDRETEWLQIATFAMRGHGVDGARDSFVKAKHERMDYDMDMINGVFKEVNEIMAERGRVR